MKKYRIKNYRGNLLESLRKFSEVHSGMRIVEAVEAEDELKITAEDNSDSSNSLKTDISKFRKEISDLAKKWKTAANKEYAKKGSADFSPPDPVDMANVLFYVGSLLDGIAKGKDRIEQGIKDGFLYAARFLTKKEREDEIQSKYGDKRDYLRDFE